LLTADDISEFLQKRGFALRKPLFYPLNYGDRKEGKSKKDEGKIQMSEVRF